MTSPRNRKSWPAESIQKARQAPLKPLLEQLGYRLDPLENDNWKTYGLPQEIVIRACPKRAVFLEPVRFGFSRSFINGIEGATLHPMNTNDAVSRRLRAHPCL